MVRVLGQVTVPMKPPKSLRSLFSPPGFVATSVLLGVFGDPYARVVVLQRRKKRQFALSAGTDAGPGTTGKSAGSEIFRRRGGVSIFSSSGGASAARGATVCT